MKAMGTTARPIAIERIAIAGQVASGAGSYVSSPQGIKIGSTSTTARIAVVAANKGRSGLWLATLSCVALSF